MTKKFMIRCKNCAGGWVLMDVSYEDQDSAVSIFPRLLCLGCGAAEDVRSHLVRTVPGLSATLEPTA